MRLLVTYDAAAFRTMIAGMDAAASGEFRTQMAQALNEAAHGIRAKTVAAETVQTGLTGDVIDRAQQEIDATAANLSYTITSHGGNVRMKFFGAQESGSGVTAHPWNRNVFTQGGFIKAGWARRVNLPWAGEVKQRKGRSRLPTRTVRSDLFIPTEMVQGKTASAFGAGAGPALSAISARLMTLLA